MVDRKLNEEFSQQNPAELTHTVFSPAGTPYTYHWSKTSDLLESPIIATDAERHKFKELLRLSK